MKKKTSKNLQPRELKEEKPIVAFSKHAIIQASVRLIDTSIIKDIFYKAKLVYLFHDKSHGLFYRYQFKDIVFIATPYGKQKFHVVTLWREDYFDNAI